MIKAVVLLLVLCIFSFSCVNNKPDTTAPLKGSWLYVGIFDSRKDNIQDEIKRFNPSKSICKVEFSDEGTYSAKIRQEEIVGDFNYTIKESGDNYVEGELENLLNESPDYAASDSFLKQMIGEANYFKIINNTTDDKSGKLYLSVDHYNYLLFTKN